MSALQEPTVINSALQYLVLQPAAELSRHVRCYFVVDSQRSAYLHEELLIPDGYSEIVFAFAAGFDRRSLSDPQKRSMISQSYLIGGRSESVITGGSQHLRLVGVKLDPTFLRQIIKVPLSEFSDSTLDLRTLQVPALLDLEDELADCAAPSVIAATLDRFFLQRMDRMHRHDMLVTLAVRCIHQSRGHGFVHAWARALNVSERTLERRFCDSMGLSPKRYARLVRFNDVYRRLLFCRRRGEAFSAASCLQGYYDQAHFNSEFRYFTAHSPSALMKSGLSPSTAVNDHLISHLDHEALDGQTGSLR